MQKFVIPLLVTVAVVIGAVLIANRYSLAPDQQGQIVTEQAPETQPLTDEEKATIKTEMSELEVMVTNGVKHTVPLSEIVGGGPPQDGIPSIDDPKFVTIQAASEWLDDSEPGIAYSSGSTHRFYPFQILVWHEIVNDTVEGKRVMVTYCPLCLTATVFDPVVDGDRVEFGTSGKLWQSNLVMYDRKTDSYWSQILGESIKGPMAGTKFTVLPSDQMRFGTWREQFPDGQVLSRDTGATRFYGTNPYGDYFKVQTGLSGSLVGGFDKRLAPDAFVFGVLVGDKAKAYSIDAVKDAGRVEDTFSGTVFVLEYDRELDVVRIFKKLPDGNLERFNPISGFWFSWAAAHPETELYQ